MQLHFIAALPVFPATQIRVSVTYAFSPVASSASAAATASQGAALVAALVAVLVGAGSSGAVTSDLVYPISISPDPAIAGIEFTVAVLSGSYDAADSLRALLASQSTLAAMATAFAPSATASISHGPQVTPPPPPTRPPPQAPSTSPGLDSPNVMGVQPAITGGRCNSTADCGTSGACPWGTCLCTRPGGYCIAGDDTIASGLSGWRLAAVAAGVPLATLAFIVAVCPFLAWACRRRRRRQRMLLHAAAGKVACGVGNEAKGENVDEEVQQADSTKDASVVTTWDEGKSNLEIADEESVPELAGIVTTNPTHTNDEDGLNYLPPFPPPLPPPIPPLLQSPSFSRIRSTVAPRIAKLPPLLEPIATTQQPASSQHAGLLQRSISSSTQSTNHCASSLASR